MYYNSPDLGSALLDGGEIIEVRTGSDSDFPKIQEVLDGLQKNNIPYILRILSAHRTSSDMADAAQAFPEVLLPPAIRGAIDLNNLRTKFCIAAAGGSAHIAGMTASETQTPVIALPVISSSMECIDSSLSMIDMPPGIPNGFVPNNDICTKVSQGLYSLSLLGEENGIYLTREQMSLMSEEDLQLLDFLGLRHNYDSKIGIFQETLDDPIVLGSTKNDFNIIIPTFGPTLSSTDVVNKISHGNFNSEGVYMGIQRLGNDGMIKYKNAILYAAQVIGMFNPIVRAKLDEYREGLKAEVRAKEQKGFLQQILSPAKRALFDSTLWPKDKMMTLERGDEELEQLGYELFYKGKNADLYLVPNTDPIQVLMLRSDRTSVFDIKLDLEIEGKGEVQTQISKQGAKFAEDRGVKTCFTELPNSIPDALQDRCQTMELCKPLTMEIDGEEKGLELILRNYNAGSLYNKFYKKNIENPYGVELPEGMNEWEKFPEPIFTPTTKDKQDTPVNSDMVREKFPELIAKLEKLFADFTQFMYERGYVVVDTKVEVFVNAQGKPVLGDEIFTPESSRFIKVEDFKAGEFISADKQIIRNLGEEFGWEARLDEILDKNPKADRYLEVSDEVTKEKRTELLDGYRDIHAAMAA